LLYNPLAGIAGNRGWLIDSAAIANGLNCRRVPIMKRLHLLPLTALAAVLVFTHSGMSQSSNSPPRGWYQRGANGQIELQLYFFWSQTCPRCPKAHGFVNQMKGRHNWLRVHAYEISANPGNRELYRQMAANLNRVGGQVPAFFFCKRLEIGYETYEQHGRRIEQALVRCHDVLQQRERQKTAPATGRSAVRQTAPLAYLFTGLITGTDESAEPMPAAAEDGNDEFPADLLPEEETVAVPWLGERRPDELSLPALTLILAACDAFNPCAFFVLLTLLGVLVHGRSRPRMLLVGGTFVLMSGLFYFLFMAAWLNLFFVVGHLTVITTIAGAVAIVAALINIKDYFWYKHGVSLTIPETAKPGLYRRMALLTESSSLAALLLGSITLAAAANLYELLCTSGFPLVYTRVLTLRQLPPAGYYSYLVLYNLIYVTPLALIVLAFTFTLGRRKLTEHEGRVLKLFSGTLMLGLGFALLLRPELLSSAIGAVGILVFALLFASAVLLIGAVRANMADQLHAKPAATRSH